MSFLIALIFSALPVVVADNGQVLGSTKTLCILNKFITVLIFIHLTVRPCGNRLRIHFRQFA